MSGSSPPAPLLSNTAPLPKPVLPRVKTTLTVLVDELEAEFASAFDAVLRSNYGTRRDRTSKPLEEATELALWEVFPRGLPFYAHYLSAFDALASRDSLQPIVEYSLTWLPFRQEAATHRELFMSKLRERERIDAEKLGELMGAMALTVGADIIRLLLRHAAGARRAYIPEDTVMMLIDCAFSVFRPLPFKRLPAQLLSAFRNDYFNGWSMVIGVLSLMKPLQVCNAFIAAVEAMARKKSSEDTPLIFHAMRHIQLDLRSGAAVRAANQLLAHHLMLFETKKKIPLTLAQLESLELLLLQFGQVRAAPLIPSQVSVAMTSVLSTGGGNSSPKAPALLSHLQTSANPVSPSPPPLEKRNSFDTDAGIADLWARMQLIYSHISNRCLKLSELKLASIRVMVSILVCSPLPFFQENVGAFIERRILSQLQKEHKRENCLVCLLRLLRGPVSPSLSGRHTGYAPHANRTSSNSSASNSFRGALAISALAGPTKSRPGREAAADHDASGANAPSTSGHTSSSVPHESDPGSEGAQPALSPVSPVSPFIGATTLDSSSDLVVVGVAAQKQAAANPSQSTRKPGAVFSRTMRSDEASTTTLSRLKAIATELVSTKFPRLGTTLDLTAEILLQIASFGVEAFVREIFPLLFPEKPTNPETLAVGVAVLRHMLDPASGFANGCVQNPQNAPDVVDELLRSLPKKMYPAIGGILAIAKEKAGLKVFGCTAVLAAYRSSAVGMKRTYPAAKIPDRLHWLDVARECVSCLAVLVHPHWGFSGLPAPKAVTDTDHWATLVAHYDQELAHATYLSLRQIVESAPKLRAELVQALVSALLSQQSEYSSPAATVALLETLCELLDLWRLRLPREAKGSSPSSSRAPSMTNLGANGGASPTAQSASAAPPTQTTTAAYSAQFLSETWLVKIDATALGLLTHSAREVRIPALRLPFLLAMLQGLHKRLFGALLKDADFKSPPRLAMVLDLHERHIIQRSRFRYILGEVGLPDLATSALPLYPELPLQQAVWGEQPELWSLMLAEIGAACVEMGCVSTLGVLRSFLCTRVAQLATLVVPATTSLLAAQSSGTTATTGTAGVAPAAPSTPVQAPAVSLSASGSGTPAGSSATSGVVVGTSSVAANSTPAPPPPPLPSSNSLGGLVSHAQQPEATQPLPGPSSSSVPSGGGPATPSSAAGTGAAQSAEDDAESFQEALMLAWRGTHMLLFSIMGVSFETARGRQASQQPSPYLPNRATLRLAADDSQFKALDLSSVHDLLGSFLPTFWNNLLLDVRWVRESVADVIGTLNWRSIGVALHSLQQWLAVGSEKKEQRRKRKAKTFLDVTAIYKAIASSWFFSQALSADHRVLQFYIDHIAETNAYFFQPDPTVAGSTGAPGFGTGLTPPVVPSSPLSAPGLSGVSSGQPQAGAAAAGARAAQTPPQLSSEAKIFLNIPSAFEELLFYTNHAIIVRQLSSSLLKPTVVPPSGILRRSVRSSIDSKHPWNLNSRYISFLVLRSLSGHGPDAQPRLNADQAEMTKLMTKGSTKKLELFEKATALLQLSSHQAIESLLLLDNLFPLRKDRFEEHEVAWFIEAERRGFRVLRSILSFLFQGVLAPFVDMTYTSDDDVGALFFHAICDVYLAHKQPPVPFSPAFFAEQQRVLEYFSKVSEQLHEGDSAVFGKPTRQDDDLIAATAPQMGVLLALSFLRLISPAVPVRIRAFQLVSRLTLTVCSPATAEEFRAALESHAVPLCSEVAATAQQQALEISELCAKHCPIVSEQLFYEILSRLRSEESKKPQFLDFTQKAFLLEILVPWCANVAISVSTPTLSPVDSSPSPSPAVSLFASRMTETPIVSPVAATGSAPIGTPLGEEAELHAASPSPGTPQHPQLSRPQSPHPGFSENFLDLLLSVTGELELSPLFERARKLWKCLASSPAELANNHAILLSYLFKMTSCASSRLQPVCLALFSALFSLEPSATAAFLAKKLLPPPPNRPDIAFTHPNTASRSSVNLPSDTSDLSRAAHRFFPSAMRYSTNPRGFLPNEKRKNMTFAQFVVGTVRSIPQSERTNSITGVRLTLRRPSNADASTPTAPSFSHSVRPHLLHQQPSTTSILRPFLADEALPAPHAAVFLLSSLMPENFGPFLPHLSTIMAYCVLHFDPYSWGTPHHARHLNSVLAAVLFSLCSHHKHLPFAPGSVSVDPHAMSPSSVRTLAALSAFLAMPPVLFFFAFSELSPIDSVHDDHAELSRYFHVDAISFFSFLSEAVQPLFPGFAQQIGDDFSQWLLRCGDLRIMLKAEQASRHFALSSVLAGVTPRIQLLSSLVDATTACACLTVSLRHSPHHVPKTANLEPESSTQSDANGRAPVVPSTSVSSLRLRYLVRNVQGLLLSFRAALLRVVAQETPMTDREAAAGGLVFWAAAAIVVPPSASIVMHPVLAELTASALPCLAALMRIPGPLTQPNLGPLLNKPGLAIPQSPFSTLQRAIIKGLLHPSCIGDALSIIAQLSGFASVSPLFMENTLAGHLLNLVVLIPFLHSSALPYLAGSADAAVGAHLAGMAADVLQPHLPADAILVLRDFANLQQQGDADQFLRSLVFLSSFGELIIKHCAHQTSEILLLMLRDGIPSLQASVLKFSAVLLAIPSAADVADCFAPFLQLVILRVHRGQRFAKNVAAVAPRPSEVAQQHVHANSEATCSYTSAFLDIFRALEAVSSYASSGVLPGIAEDSAPASAQTVIAKSPPPERAVKVDEGTPMHPVGIPATQLDQAPPLVPKVAPVTPAPKQAQPVRPVADSTPTAHHYHYRLGSLSHYRAPSEDLLRHHDALIQSSALLQGFLSGSPLNSTAVLETDDQQVEESGEFTHGLGQEEDDDTPLLPREEEPDIQPPLHATEPIPTFSPHWILTPHDDHVFDPKAPSLMSVVRSPHLMTFLWDFFVESPKIKCAPLLFYIRTHVFLAL
eukprot:TRINITY_DN1719_c0_g1_i3.p1 TRINITY_DN1719_c0_g1~~TRINITY_DN1719_c0_g1_i3.p1  ORF type:complete len:2936 (+),score=528.20 TRINITY_DN1719_c0_g1_i3:185-8992(+)